MPSQQSATYRLTRDDGEEILVRGSTWESALELAFLYGWRPAGTETPPTGAWRSRRATGARWDSSDYFSHQSQHVGEADARALAKAVDSALLAIPDWSSNAAKGSAADACVARTPVPSRASAVADGLSDPRRNLVRKVAAFASRGGFTIGAAS